MTMTPDEIKAKVQKRWPTLGFDFDDFEGLGEIGRYVMADDEDCLTSHDHTKWLVDLAIDEDFKVLGILDTHTGEWLKGTIKGTQREITLP